eukprot:CAMPEP_0177542330 /NCGR_PEP_ID=MMETSP0369-20130122/60729_1 /TAXON_ID=447022 ORGANISM="Scrippsiella hangoei-like, Strain SHHI-4" /NCGR_SAMPLE_ID=MMETSP0369 /ASSEMBLY_ACC=CAM_ASM_000364 /LENGTH=150 /DNA_ID=CAMNT_0019025953 /DNA_START=1 /DNA_END=451 /DNA_ORIENTATION=+
MHTRRRAGTTAHPRPEEPNPDMQHPRAFKIRTLRRSSGKLLTSGVILELQDLGARKIRTTRRGSGKLLTSEAILEHRRSGKGLVRCLVCPEGFANYDGCVAHQQASGHEGKPRTRRTKSRSVDLEARSQSTRRSGVTDGQLLTVAALRLK